MWPTTAAALTRVQHEIASLSPPPWRGSVPGLLVAGCYICFGRGVSREGQQEERSWAAAALMRDGRLIWSAVGACVARARYAPGLLALREGPPLESAVRALPERPDLLIVHATGRDHPRGAGLALHLGAVLDIPSIGVTDRPLHAVGEAPGPERGAASPMFADGVETACLLRTRADARALVVHAGWRTDLNAAVSVALATTRNARTPEPLRCARHLARHARSAAGPPRTG
jgi:deoxyribonuclease V